MDTSAVEIPVDLFVSKKHEGLAAGEVGFADSSGNLVFKANRISSSSSNKWVIVDASGNSLFSIHRHTNGCWHGYKGNNNNNNNEMAFRVERRNNKFKRRELQVFLVKENSTTTATSDFKLIGCPSQRSCIIYASNAIVAQTSLMYKLHQIFVGRSRFRLTIFPGFTDHALVVAFIVIFLYG